MKDLSPRDLARSLGISESSVKRWVDAGALRAVRTAGGHRRISAAEAVRFLRQSGTPLVHPELILGPGAAQTAPAPAFAPGQLDDVAERFFALLERDNAPAARALLLSLYTAGWPVASICDGPMRAALEKIGTLWEHGPAGLVIEHRATDTCIRALAEIRALHPEPAPDAPVAIGCAPSGDQYILPSMMAATILAELGYRDHNLGPDVPASALAEAAVHYRPRIVWIAMSAVQDGASVERTLTELSASITRVGASLIVGGRGVPAFVPPAGVIRMHSMSELAAFARGVLTPGAPAGS